MANTTRPAFTAGVILGVLYLVCAVLSVPAEVIVLLAAPYLFFADRWHRTCTAGETRPRRGPGKALKSARWRELSAV